MCSDLIKESFKRCSFCNYHSVNNPSLVKHYWDDLHTDQYVKEAYRLRRFSVMNYKDGEIKSIVDEPHYQAIQHNTVYGGIRRKFLPIEKDFIWSEFSRGVINECVRLIDKPRQDWRIEMHQFRIKAPGNPTPEGVHHDGADFVLSMLIDRKNMTGGKMMIYDDTEKLLFEHTMESSGECIFLNDREVMHGVTNIKSTGAEMAYRDVLVVAFFAANDSSLHLNKQADN